MAIPNGEKIVSDYLRETLGVRVVGQTPQSRATSWVKVVQLDARQMPNFARDHLVEFWLQCDCYAGAEGGQPEAKALGDEVRDALVQIDESDHDAVVTAGRINGHARIPDDDGFEPARERVIVTTQVWMHE